MNHTEAIQIISDFNQMHTCSKSELTAIKTIVDNYNYESIDTIVSELLSNYNARNISDYQYEQLLRSALRRAFLDGKRINEMK